MAGHDSDGQLTAAARLAGLGYWSVEVHDKRVSWSEESCRVLGLPPAERARSWAEFLEIVHPEDRRRLEECLTRVARGEPGHRIGFRLMIGGDGIRHRRCSISTTRCSTCSSC